MEFDRFKDQLGGSTEEQNKYVEKIKERHEESVKNHKIYMQYSKQEFKLNE